MSGQILDGIRVLDFSRYIAGPYCAALLGHLGADVIRIEKPGGSEDRFVTPLNDQSNGNSDDPAGALFQQTCANKRSITLNLKQPEAREIVERLVSSADVVIANMPPQALKRAGLEYATLKAIKSDIILTTQTGFGHDGPWANRGGFDGVGQAMSGASFFAGLDGQPVKSAAPYADFGTALYGAYATLGALYERRTSGLGQHIQASLLGTALSFFNPLLAEHAVTGITRTPSGTRGQTTAPSDIFRARDGHVLIHVVGDGLFKRIAEVVGKTEWPNNPSYRDDQSRGDLSAELCAPVAEWCSTRTREEVLTAMGGAGVPCGPVLEIDEVLQHEQIKAMSFFQNFDYPGLNHAIPVADFPISMSVSEVGHRDRAPQIGEHTESIMTELGYDPEQIKNLRQESVI